MRWAEGIDKLGIGLYLLLCIFAIVNIHSVDDALGQKQMIFFGISLFIGVIIFLMRSKFFENMSGIIYIFGVLLLIGLFPFGTEILGQKNWYKFGSITMQPVEFAKIGTSLMLANYVSGPDFNLKRTNSFVTVLAVIGIPAFVVLLIPDVGSLLVFTAFVIALYREGLSGWFFIVPIVLGVIFFSSLLLTPFPVVLFIALLGNAILLLHLNNIKPNLPILFILLFGILIAAYISTINTTTLAIIIIIAKIISVVATINLIIVIVKVIRKELNLSILLRAFLIIIIASFVGNISFYSVKVLEKLPKHQRERIEVLYKGEKAFRDTSGYNLLYSKTAIGSGGFFGKGYKQGSVTQGKFVPEQETDYIFCTVGEEWGFFGSSILVLFYVVFIGRIYYLSERQKSDFNRVFGYCFASILLMHFCINLGMVMGLFPTVGIPLPFFSYGGSSLLAFSIMTFIFFKLNYTDKNSLV